jgi:hypothetical protein
MSVHRVGNADVVCECVVERRARIRELAGEDRKRFGSSRYWADEGRVSSKWKRRGRGSDDSLIGAEGRVGDEWRREARTRLHVRSVIAPMGAAVIALIRLECVENPRER